MTICASQAVQVRGEFVNMQGERFYAIYHVDQMPPFFISVVSDSDHWLFASSTGGLSAGRVSPEAALFPYVTVDKIHESTVHTGGKTLIRIAQQEVKREWEPFNLEHDGLYHINRHLYKNVLGNKLCFEEVNEDLQLAFRYTWQSSHEFGFVRHAELTNLGDYSVELDLLDGLQNILPAGTPGFTQTKSSNLVDAYKWNELDQQTGLALYTLYSAITDRAEPCESLRANTVFSLGLDKPSILLSAEQLEAFRLDLPLTQRAFTRGTRGAYLLSTHLSLAAGASKNWQIVANLEQSQAQVVALQRMLQSPEPVADKIRTSIQQGTDKLARIMASADGFQHSSEEQVTVHHYTNVLFNVLRGGVFDDQYQISSADFTRTIKAFNRNIYLHHQTWLDALPDSLDHAELLAMVGQKQDTQLLRLTLEYLPITFGRRHGDPSRPWNQFAIKLQDEQGQRILSYEGNWRDIFQNWEALCLSFPHYIESVIAKFVNASTVDGYNPYRITKQGIDWEVEEPDDPWSYIGYWGDHQIIYLLKLLEWSRQFQPKRLTELLRSRLFAYANVPYRLKPFEQTLLDPKNTVLFDEQLAAKIDQRCQVIGADGKLLVDENGQVYQVTLLEKLLVPMLCKLSNLVMDGGIWLNTQRPEWNDANNALVGQGLSMVTLYYLRRYLRFMQSLLNQKQGQFELTLEVNQWLIKTQTCFAQLRPKLSGTPIDARLRLDTLYQLGQAASDYRQQVYRQEGFSGMAHQQINLVCKLCEDAQAALDQCIATNLRQDGLYQAYNLLDLTPHELNIKSLYPMLEGQVAALSSGALSAQQAIKVVEQLFNSDIFRDDQDTFMLYPDRDLPGFLQKNRLPDTQVEAIPLLTRMLANRDRRLVQQDVQGCYRFHPDLTNAGALNQRLAELHDDYAELVTEATPTLQQLYESVFNHQAFTGRSGGMFGFEGLGCVYWHMVAKLLLAVQENFYQAIEQGADAAAIGRLGKLYYRVREGLGFNKTPLQYGAFPTDPYSHTPKHAGAQQPGMTGQVKEELITRFGELGIRVQDGMIHFVPALLRAREFTQQAASMRYLDVDNQWQTLALAPHSLAFTWCQVPLIYQLDDLQAGRLVIEQSDGQQLTLNPLCLDATLAREIFQRSGKIRKVKIVLASDGLFEP